MTEKRFDVENQGGIWVFHENGLIIGYIGVANKLNELNDENKQLKQQLKIFEKFLEVNDLSIEWDEFCGVDECAFKNPDFSCKECIHLKGDVE